LNPESRSFLSFARERISQSLCFKRKAKKREQRIAKQYGPPRRDRKINIQVKLRKMPEDDSAEERAAENKSKPTEEQEYVAQNHMGARNGIGT
jgi:hypothetical protein